MRFQAWLCLSLVTMSVQAADSYFVNQRREASMLVTGVVNLRPDGSVRDYQLDQPEKLTEPVKDVIGKNVTRWKFQFADAQTSSASERMYLRIVATMTDNEHASLRLAGTDFDDVATGEGESIQQLGHPRLEYPKQAIEEHASGTVFLLMRIGPDGKVQEVSAEQVNLSKFAPSADMARYRKYLADAAVNSAKKWTFVIPTKGKEAGRPFWLVRAAANFVLSGEDHSDYGSWTLYVPGPREHISWLDHPRLASEAADAVPEGVLQSLNDGLRLSDGGDGG